MHWKDVLAEMLQPQEKLGSVIDTYMALGEILEKRSHVKDSKNLKLEDYDKALLYGMFTLGFMPFWSSSGAGLRPLIMQAFAKDPKEAIPFFFTEAIPFALTVAMPLRQHEYDQIRQVVKAKFEKA